MNAPTVRTGRRALLLCLILCPALVGSVLADDLGRLFTSTTERARIDAVRSGKQPLVEEDATASTPATDRVVINGTLRGSNGKRLVWLNGTPVKPDSRHDMTLLRDGRVQLTWQDGAKILKPGQGVDQASGKIFDSITPVPAPVASAAAEITKPQAEAADPAATTAPPATAGVTAGASASTATAEPAPAVESKAK
jgi:hypothetical protein